MTKNTYCAYPFNEIYSDNSSIYRLCCFAKPNKTLQKYNVQNTLPFDYFMSEEMEDIRQQFLEGVEVKGCEYCWKLEKNNRPSPRTTKYAIKYPKVTEVDKVDLKLRIGGSNCNLGCYMCIPYNSSTRRLELKQSGADDIWKYTDINSTPKNVSNKRFNEIIDDLLKNINRIRSIKFIGGEPILIDRMWKILDAVPNEYAQHINVTFQTNLTHLNYNNHNVFDIANKYNDLKMHVSADHYGERLGWIRYPIDVKLFEQNLKDAKDLISGIAVTTSILNIFDLHDIRDYYQDNFGLRVDLDNVVSEPKMLSCKNLLEKDKFLEKYVGDDTKMVYNELVKDRDDKEIQQGIMYCLKLSKHRNLDFWKIFPHVAKEII